MDTVTSMVISGDYPSHGSDLLHYSEPTGSESIRKRSHSEDCGNAGEVGDEEDVAETNNSTSMPVATINTIKESLTSTVTPHDHGQEDEGFVEDGETISQPHNSLSSTTNEKKMGTNRVKSNRGFLIEDLPVAMAVPFLEFLDDHSEEYSRLPLAEATLVHASKKNFQTTATRRGGMISVNVFKENKDTKLGIRFAEYDGILTVGGVTGLLEPSPLRSGDQVIRLDGQAVAGWTPTKAVHYLRDRVGFISIVARNVHGDFSRSEIAVYKSNNGDKLGISFAHNEYGKDEEKKSLVIQSLNVAGLLGGSRSILQIGDVVESIQSIKTCDMAGPSDAISFIREISGFVTMVTRKPDNHDPCNDAPVVNVRLSKGTTKSSEEAEGGQTVGNETLVAMEHDLMTRTTVAETFDEYTAPAFVSVMACKENTDVRLGIKLVSSKDKIIITGVSRNGGLLKSSPLQEGMQLLSINNISMEGMASAKDALLMLRGIVGDVHLMAYNPHGNPEFCEAMVSKSSENSSVGVSFKGSTGRQLKICIIRQDGLFSQSSLNVSDKVISINGISCRSKRPREAVDIVRNATETVTILTKSKATTGVVICECHQ